MTGVLRRDIDLEFRHPKTSLYLLDEVLCRLLVRVVSISIPIQEKKTQETNKKTGCGYVAKTKQGIALATDNS